jgi:hypothetical protein
MELINKLFYNRVEHYFENGERCFDFQAIRERNITSPVTSFRNMSVGNKFIELELGTFSIILCRLRSLHSFYSQTKLN